MRRITSVVDQSTKRRFSLTSDVVHARGNFSKNKKQKKVSRKIWEPYFNVIKSLIFKKSNLEVLKLQKQKLFREKRTQRLFFSFLFLFLVNVRPNFSIFEFLNHAFTIIIHTHRETHTHARIYDNNKGAYIIFSGKRGEGKISKKKSIWYLYFNIHKNRLYVAYCN